MRPRKDSADRDALHRAKSLLVLGDSEAVGQHCPSYQAITQRKKAKLRRRPEQNAFSYNNNNNNNNVAS